MQQKQVPQTRTSRLTGGQALLLTEAGLLLIAAKLAVKTIPFRLPAQQFGPANAEWTDAVEENDSINAVQTGWAVRAIARCIPILEQCLLQAIAARWMLNRRGIANTLYFGVLKEENQFAAHAWLQVGDRIVVGGRSRKKHRIIAALGAKVS